MYVSYKPELDLQWKLWRSRFNNLNYAKKSKDFSFLEVILQQDQK